MSQEMRRKVQLEVRNMNVEAKSVGLIAGN